MNGERLRPIRLSGPSWGDCRACHSPSSSDSLGRASVEGGARWENALQTEYHGTAGRMPRAAATDHTDTPCVHGNQAFTRAGLQEGSGSVEGGMLGRRT